MADRSRTTPDSRRPRREAVAECHLLGPLDFDRCLALQERLVYEAGGRDDGQIVVLLCEHPRLITIGRRGSRGHVRMSSEALRREKIPLRWMNRGGGCLLHGHGQLAVYPIVPLDWHGWTVGEYLDRLQRGLRSALEQLRVPVHCCPGHWGLWGRTGLLAAVGVSVRRNITHFGAYLNVNPSMSQYGAIHAAAPESLPEGEKPTMGCLLAERGRALRMPAVRSALIPALVEAFGSSRYHLHTGHPLLTQPESQRRAPAARAS